MSDIKLQFVCFLITGFIFVRYIRLSKIFPTTQYSNIFKWLLTVSFLETIFDTATAYSVNNPSVPLWINTTLHWIFYILIDTEMYIAYIYFLTTLPRIEKKAYNISIVGVIYILNMLVVSISMPYVEYIKGDITNYSYGAPVYTCFLMAFLYVLLLVCQLLINWKEVSGAQRANAITILTVLTLVSTIQFFFPESLITGLMSVFVSIAVYVNQEDPLRYKYFLENEKMQEELNKANLLLEAREEKKEEDHVAIFYTTNNQTIKVKYSDIICIESVANYVNLYILFNKTMKTLQVRQTLVSILEQLADSDVMIQVHRSFIINKEHVVKVESSSRKCFLYLDNLDNPVPVSRNTEMVANILRAPASLPSHVSNVSFQKMVK